MEREKKNRHNLQSGEELNLCRDRLITIGSLSSLFVPSSFAEVTTTTTTTAQTLTYKDGESDETNQISRLEAVVGSHEGRDDHGKTPRDHHRVAHLPTFPESIHLPLYLALWLCTSNCPLLHHRVSSSPMNHLSTRCTRNYYSSRILFLVCPCCYVPQLVCH